MKKHRVLRVWTFLVLAVSACSVNALPASMIPTSTPPPMSTVTATFPPTASPSRVASTLTPTLEPTPAPLLSPIPLEPVIGRANIPLLTRLAEIETSRFGNIRAASWSPDGIYLAVADETTLWLLNALTWEAAWQTKTEEKTTGLLFSPDGSRLVVQAEAGLANVLDSITGENLFRIGNSPAAFSMDGSLVVDAFSIYDVAKGEELRELKQPAFTDETIESPVAVAFNREGNQVVMGMDGGGFIRWNASNGSLLQHIPGKNIHRSCRGHGESGSGLVLTCEIPNADYSVIAVKLYYSRLNAPFAVASLSSHGLTEKPYGYNTLVWGKSQLALSVKGKIVLYELTANMAQSKSWDRPEGMDGFAVYGGKGGVRVAAWKGRSLEIWNPAAGQLLADLGGSAIARLAFHPTQPRLLAYGKRNGVLALRDLTSDQPLLYTSAHSAGDIAIAFSPDGKMLASGGMDELVSLWPVNHKSPKPITRKKFFYPVAALAFSPTSDRLAIIPRNLWSFFLWNLTPKFDGDQHYVRSNLSSTFSSVAFSPDARWLVVGSDKGILQVYDAETENENYQLSDGRKLIFHRLSFGVGGNLLLAPGSGLWNIESREQLLELDATALSAALSPDQCLVAIGKVNGSIAFWDMESRTYLNTLSAFSDPVTDIAFSPDGKLLVAGSQGGVLTAWGIQGALAESGSVPGVRCR